MNQHIFYPKKLFQQWTSNIDTWIDGTNEKIMNSIEGHINHLRKIDISIQEDQD